MAVDTDFAEAIEKGVALDHMIEIFDVIITQPVQTHAEAEIVKKLIRRAYWIGFEHGQKDEKRKILEIVEKLENERKENGIESTD
jgi:hypothetical protein